MCSYGQLVLNLCDGLQDFDEQESLNLHEAPEFKLITKDHYWLTLKNASFHIACSTTHNKSFVYT